MCEIIVQVGPNIDIIAYASDFINNKLLDKEASMLVRELVNLDLAKEKVTYAVRFRNDDLGNKIKYPILIIDGKYYEIQGLGRNEN